MESFSFILVEYQNERDGLALESYFRMPQKVDFSGSYIYKVGIPADQYTPNTMWIKCINVKAE